MINSLVTLENIKSVSEKLNQEKINKLLKDIKHENLKTPVVQENQDEIDKLKSALEFLSPDTARGYGSFYTKDGQPEPDYWLACIWSMRSLGHWKFIEGIARNWSQKSKRYTEEGFSQAWNSYKPNHPRAIGIGSLYKKASDLGWAHAPKDFMPDFLPPIESITEIPEWLNIENTESKEDKFTLLSLDEISGLTQVDWIIKGILPSNGLASVFGPSGCGKTFLVLDMAMSIASQSDWFGFKVKNVPVVYMGLEGKAGITRRLQAWMNKHQTKPTNFKVVLDNFDLMTTSQVILLANVINRAQMGYGVIVIDTLNQASPNADENGSKDMGQIIQNMKLLQEETNSLILIVHHTGKNTMAGLRGHSSLKAALDTNIEVKTGEPRSWIVEKSKDGEGGISFNFNLDIQKIGQDPDGEDITSCTVERNINAIFIKKEPSGKAQKIAYQIIKKELASSSDFDKASKTFGVSCIRVEYAILKVANELVTVAKNKRSNRARTLITDLVNGLFLSAGSDSKGEDWLWTS